MEETLVHSVLLSVPRAAAIWLVILAVAVIAVAGLSVPGRRPTRDDPDPPVRTDGDPSGFAAARAAADRYADEIEVAAERAAVTARHGREAWERAQDRLDEAWAAFEAADRAARRSAAATAFGTPDGSRLPAGEVDDGVGQPTQADRERYLHRAATAACRRRELTVHELNDILAHRGDWDPHLHPVVQEAALHRAVRRRALAAYGDAATRERQAWRTSEVAAAALRSLREEACVARLRVEADQIQDRLWWAGEPADAGAVATAPPAPGSEDSSTTVAWPAPAVRDDAVTTVAWPAPAVRDDAVTTVAWPAPVGAQDGVTTVALPVSARPIGPLVVVPLPAVALAALQASTVQLPTVPVHDSRPASTGTPAQASTQVVPAQAGAPTVESLRQPLAAAGVDGHRG